MKTYLEPEEIALVINLASWSFTLYYLAGAIVVWAVVLYLSRLLTKEQIVLSSKGG